MEPGSPPSFRSIEARLSAVVAEHAGGWPADAHTFLELRRRELELIDHFWPIPQVETALEIGGGALAQAAMLASRARRYVTIDLMETHGMGLRNRSDLVARLGLSQLKPVVARGEAVPLRNGCVDLVYSSNVFEHLEDQRKCASEIARVLRPGGHCVLVVPTPWTRVNYFIEQYLLLLPNIVARFGRFLRKRYVTTAVPVAARRDAARLEYIRREPLWRLALREATAMLRFAPHGEHYANAWEEILDYRIAKWRSLFPETSFELVALFTDRMNAEWFGSRINLRVYRALMPINRLVGARWPFYNFGHEITLVYRRR